MRVAGLVVAAVLMLGLAGCGNGQGASGCERVELKGPNGEAIDLTGDWTGNDRGRYSLKQIDGCLWWVGLSDFPGEDPGETWSNVFRGRIGSDMRITGEFTDVRSADKTAGMLTLRVDAQEVEGETVVTLRRESVTGASFGGTYWERAGDTDREGSVIGGG